MRTQYGKCCFNSNKNRLQYSIAPILDLWSVHTRKPRHANSTGYDQSDDTLIPCVLFMLFCWTLVHDTEQSTHASPQSITSQRFLFVVRATGDADVCVCVYVFAARTCRHGKRQWQRHLFAPFSNVNKTHRVICQIVYRTANTEHDSVGKAPIQSALTHIVSVRGKCRALKPLAFTIGSSASFITRLDTWRAIDDMTGMKATRNGSLWSWSRVEVYLRC